MPALKTGYLVARAAAMSPPMEIPAVVTSL